MGSNHTLISKGTQILGDVTFHGECIVQGSVIGNIEADANAELEIGPTGRVEGVVKVPKLVVRGQVQGEIRCAKHLELGATAVVNGDVFYALIEMVKGAQVNGNMVHLHDGDKPEGGSDAPGNPPSLLRGKRKS